MSPYPYFKTVIKLNEEVTLSASQICKCIERHRISFSALTGCLYLFCILEDVSIVPLTS